MDEEQLYRIYEAHRKQGASHEEALKSVELAQSGAEPDTEELAAQKRLSAGGSATGDFGLMAAKGATLGLSGLVGGEDTREKMRQRANDLRQLAPGASMLAEIAGEIALPVGAGGTAMRGGRGILAGVARGAGTGAVMGGLTGAVEADDGHRLGGAAKGAAIGGVAGGVVGGLVPAVGALGRGAGGRGGRVAGEIQRTAGFGGDDLGKAFADAEETITRARDAYDPAFAAHGSISDPDLIAALTDEGMATATKSSAPKGGYSWIGRDPASGQMAPGVHPSGRQVQSARQTLDRLIKNAKTSEEFERFWQLKQNLDTAAEKALPELAPLNRGFAQAMGAKEALEAGTKAPAKDAAIIGKEMRDLWPSQQEPYRRGQVGARVADLTKRNEGGSAYLGDLLDPGAETLARTRTMYPEGEAGEEAYRALLKYMLREKSAKTVRGQLKPTLGKAAIAAGAGAGAGWLLE